MKKSVIVSLSVVTAVLVISGCSSDGDTTTGGSSLPGWTSSKVDINVSSAALAINEFRKGTDTPTSPVEGAMMPAPSHSGELTFDEKAAAAVAIIEAKRTPISREARREDIAKGPALAIGPSTQVHNCTVSGKVTITYDSGPWGEGVFDSRSEVHSNCVDDGSTLVGNSECAFFPLIGDGNKVTTNGSCEYEGRGYDGHFEGFYSYTSYTERWDDNVTEDVFTYSVNLKETLTGDWSDDGSVESGTFVSLFNGYFDLHGVQGIDSDAEAKFRYEAKSYSVNEKYDINMSTGDLIREEVTVNGYFASSMSGQDAEGNPIPSDGYGYYFSNIVMLDTYVDENISNFSLNGTFGSACMEGTVDFATTTILVDDKTFDVCPGEEGAMPKSGVLTISGNGEATATFFEVGVDTNNSDLNVSAADGSTVYDCWGDLPECGLPEPI